MRLCSKNLVLFLLAVTLVLTVNFLSGCKKKTESSETTTAKEVAPEEIEQKLCPVMEAAINKDLYTEYKGKKVYFCCPGCKEKFEKEPGKYISKLPQFQTK